MNVQKFRTNLNCGSCVASVSPSLNSDPRIERWSVDTSDPAKTLTVEGRDIASEHLERHLASSGFRILGSADEPTTSVGKGESRSLVSTYRPLLLVLAYLLGIVTIVEIAAVEFDWMRAMGTFMGGFFVAFSFFKLLDLAGFVDSFQSYDIVARTTRVYGYAYPFIELTLGVAYLTGIAPLITNLVTLAVMLVGIAGVTQALRQNRRIQCACLGTVFNLPMSKVTLFEDAIMAVMAACMLAGLST